MLSILRVENIQLTEEKNMLAVKEWANKVKEIQTELKATLKAAQRRQIKAYNEKHKATPSLKVRDKV